MRLEDVAREVGLAPATLLLRFKTKRNLLIAVAEHGISSMAEHFRERRRQSRSPLDAVTEVCECVREFAEHPQHLANLLAFLQLSLEDPEFRSCATRHDAALSLELEQLLDEARRRGEIVECSTQPLARAIIALIRGSLLTWGALGQGTSPDAWVRGDLETLLSPYRRPAVATARRKREARRPRVSRRPLRLTAAR
jgi:AcrR family transcriptional regulator